MKKCKECKWFQVDQTVPIFGVCQYGRGNIDNQQATAGVGMSFVPGKRIPIDNDACEDHFEPRAGSREERLSAGT